VTCFALVVTKGPQANAPAVVSSLPLGYGPVDLQTAYGLSSLSANQGTGRTVAIVDAYDDPNAEADLLVYRATYGLSPCTTANRCFRKVDENGGTSYPTPDPKWAGEISLDLDMVSAIAPNAHILLVEASTSSVADLETAVNTAASLGATEISNSYGSTDGDTGVSATDLSYYHHPGIAIFASSGDYGWNDIDLYRTYPGAGSASFPATSPDVTAVGGTSLNSTAPRQETAWGDWEGFLEGAGSGCSSVVPKPAWQTDSDCLTRFVADVSAEADPSTGVAVYDTYPPDGTGFEIVGGTSAASPIMAGVAALSPPTYFQPGFSYSHTSAFNDVTEGSNDAKFGPPYCDGTSSLPGNSQCNAGVGYDGPTGNGTPNGTTIPVPPSASIATPGGGAGYIQGQTILANYSCTEGAEGPGITSCAGDVPNGTSIDTSTPGNHTFTVTATSGDGYTRTASVTYTVQAPPTAAVVAPSDGAVYTQGQIVNANYSCIEGAGGPGLTSCTGTVPMGSAISTSTPGTYVFDATAASLDGMSGSASVTYTVKPPKPNAPQITKHPPSKTLATTAAFKFKDATKGVTFQCVVGKGRKRHGAFTRCKSPKTVHLRPGTYTFYIRARSANGYSTVTKFTWRIL
jgi:subtilase family serine protease